MTPKEGCDSADAKNENHNMRMPYFLSIGLLIVVCLADTQAASNPTIEEVYASPKKYEGQTLVFEKVKVSGSLRQGRVRYLLTIQSTAGKIFASKVRQDNLAFGTSPAIGEMLTKQLDPGRFYPVRLTCKIQETENIGWLANVMQVDFDKQGSADKAPSQPVSTGIANSHENEPAASKSESSGLMSALKDNKEIIVAAITVFGTIIAGLFGLWAKKREK